MASIQSTTVIKSIYDLIDNLDVKDKEVSVESCSNAGSTDTSTINKANIVNKTGSSISDSFDYSGKIKEKIQARNISNQAPYIEIAQNLKKTINDIINSVTEEDVKSILQSDYNPEKISLDIFKKIIDQNKTAVNEADYEKLEEEANEQVNEFREQFSDEGTLKQVITNLKKYNLPVNLKNINKVYQVLDKFDAIKDLSNGSIANLIKQNKELTVENIYKAKFTAAKNNSSDDLKELEPNIKELLKSAGLPITKDMMDLSKLLINNDVPLDDDTLSKIKLLKVQINETDINFIIQQAAGNYSKKKGLADISISGSEDATSANTSAHWTGEINQTINQLSNVNIEQIESVVSSNKTVNIKNLIYALGMNDKVSENQVEKPVVAGEAADINTKDTADTNSGDNTVKSSKDLKIIKASLNLEEIRLKMTLEAATRLKDKGISIETEPLEKVVNELRTLERETYSVHLEQNNVPVTKDNVDQMQNVFEQVHQMGHASSRVITKIANKEVDFTIKAASSAARQELLIANAVKDYDTLSTKPRRDLGDSIEKAFVNLDMQLEQMGVEATACNLRAAKILAKNELPLTQSNINAVSMVDQKVSYVTENLNPGTVAQMIKIQLSPVDMHIDTVISYMNQFNQKMGNSVDNNFSKAIFQMENDKSISNEERESVIGIYRMLNTVSKSKGEAVGFIMKNNMDLKLNNLFEAAKYIKNTKGGRSFIQADINDDFGMLQEITYDGKNIKQQIKTALGSTTLAQTKDNVLLAEALAEQGIELNHESLNKAGLNNQLLNNLISKATPEKMIALAKDGGLNDLGADIDLLLQQLSQGNNDEGNASDYEEIYNSLKSLSKVSIETLSNIEKYGMNKSLNSVLTADKLTNNPFELSKQLNNITNKLDNQSIDTSNLKEMLQKTTDASTNNYEDTIDELKDNLNHLHESILDVGSTDMSSSLKDIKHANELIDYQKAIHKQEEYYQVPIIINGKLTQLNMYYFNNQKQRNNQNEVDSLNVHMYFNTENMGKIQAHIEIENNSLNFNIYSSEPEDMELIKSFSNKIKGLLNSTKYNVQNINYDYFEGKSPINEGINKPTEGTKVYHSDSVFETTI